MPSPASGALSPDEAARETLKTGLHHLSEPILQAIIKNFMGALLLSAGSLLAQLLGNGFPQATAANPGLQRLLQGATFPVGLIVVYALGAELFTGYPMWYALTACARQGRAGQYVRSVAVVWCANLAAALVFAAVFCVATGSLTEDPWRAGVLEMVSEDLVELGWHRIFLRSVGCGWLVTVAMVLGTQNQDGISKALGLWLPFAVSTSARFMHTVEYMFVGGVGCMLGSELGWLGYCWRCLLPVTLGNTVGGGLLTGGYLWLVHLSGEEAKKAVREHEGMTQQNGIERYLDDA